MYYLSNTSKKQYLYEYTTRIHNYLYKNKRNIKLFKNRNIILAIVHDHNLIIQN